MFMTSNRDKVSKALVRLDGIQFFDSRFLGTYQCTKTTLEQAPEVSKMLNKKGVSGPKVRILCALPWGDPYFLLRSWHRVPSSLHCTLPLRIAEDLMKQILMRYQVGPEFLPVLFSFGEEPHLAESDATNVCISNHSDGSRRKG